MTAPVQTPSAPAADISQSGPFGIDNALAEISQSAIAQTLAETATPEETAEGGQPRGADGKFVPRETAEPHPDVTATPAPDAATATTDTPPEPIALPEGMVAVPAVKDRELATTFKVLDADGELDVPDLTIEFQANGKTRKESLDKVVRLAERGVYNEEREQAVVQQKHHTETVQSENQQLRAYVQQMQQERERLLSSDEAYLTERARFEQENTPEAKMERMRQERDAEQTNAVYAQALDRSNAFFEQSVLPGVETIVSNLPTVTADEIGARLVLLTNHLRVPLPNGDSFIPPANHQAVANVLLREIVPWAQQLHDARDHSTRQTREATEREKRESAQREQKAQTDAQKAKNLVGRQTRPAGRANTSNSTRETPPPKPIRTVDDAEQAALRDTLAAMA